MSMFLIFFPASIVLIALRKIFICALTISLVVFPRTLVFRTILVNHLTVAMHVLSNKITSVNTTIDVCLLKRTLVVILRPTFLHCGLVIFRNFSAICRDILSVSFLVPVGPFSVVPSTIWPRINTLTMLQIIPPPSLIDLTVGKTTCSLALTLVLVPLTLIDFTVWPLEFTETIF